MTSSRTEPWLAVLLVAAACSSGEPISQAATIAALDATPTMLAIRVGDSEQLAASATLTDGTSRDVTGGVRWESSDTLVVTVDVNGVVTAVGPGQATVTARDAHGDASATIALDVQRSRDALGVTAVSLAPEAPLLFVGEEVSFIATATKPDGSPIDATSVAVWQSSQPQVATVDNRGRVLSLGAGQTVVAASLPDDGVRARQTVTVRPEAIASVIVSGAPASLVAGETRVLSAVATTIDGATIDVTTLLNWSSSDPSVLAAGNGDGQRGRIVARAAGTATVTVQSYTGVYGASVTVDVVPRVITTVIAPTDDFRLVPGEQRSLEVLALFNDGTAANIADMLVWGVTPSAIATISGANLTAVSDGTGTVTATEPTTGTPLSVSLTVGRYANLVVDGAPLTLLETNSGSPIDPAITVNDDPLGGGQLALVRWQYEPSLSHYAHELVLSVTPPGTIFTTASNSLSMLDVEPDAAYTAKAGGSTLLHSFARLAVGAVGAVGTPYIASLDALVCVDSGCGTSHRVTGTIGAVRGPALGTVSDPYPVIMPLSTHTLAGGEAVYRFPTAGADEWTVRMTPANGSLTFSVYASADLSGAPLCTVTPAVNAAQDCTFTRTGPFAYGRVSVASSVTYNLQLALAGVDHVFATLPVGYHGEVTSLTQSGSQALSSHYTLSSIAGKVYNLEVANLTRDLTVLWSRANGTPFCADFVTGTGAVTGCNNQTLDGNTFFLDFILADTTPQPYSYGATYDFTITEH